MIAKVTVLVISADFPGGQVSKKVLAALGVTSESEAVVMKSDKSQVAPHARVYLDADLKNFGIRLNSAIASQLGVLVGETITIQT